jgi:hypothetical protein
MNNQFVSYHIALALKELGFDEPCFGMFNKEGTIKYVLDLNHCDSQEKCEYIFGIGFILAPLWQQAIDWLREKHKINIFSHSLINSKDFRFVVEKLRQPIVDHNIEFTESYPKAREQAILKAIEIIKKCKQ